MRGLSRMKRGDGGMKAAPSAVSDADPTTLPVSSGTEECAMNSDFVVLLLPTFVFFFFRFLFDLN